MERTSHYGLPIFEPDDHPSILTDFNQAMYDIDEAMFTISMGGSASAEAIEELRQGLTSVSTQIGVINQTLGTKLDDSFLNNLAPQFDAEEVYNKYDFVFKDGNLYQCADDYDPSTDTFDNCFIAVWLCNNVARNQADIEDINNSVSSLDGRVTNLENNPPTPTLPLATRSTTGVVKVGGYLNIGDDGTISGMQADTQSAKTGNVLAQRTDGMFATSGRLVNGALIKRVSEATPTQSSSGNIQVKILNTYDTHTDTKVSYEFYKTGPHKYYGKIRLNLNYSGTSVVQVILSDVSDNNVSLTSNSKWIVRCAPNRPTNTDYSAGWGEEDIQCRAFTQSAGTLTLQFKPSGSGQTQTDFILIGDDFKFVGAV